MSLTQRIISQHSKIFSLSIALLFCFKTGHAQSNYFLLYDNNFSEKTGSENLITLHKALSNSEEVILPSKIFEKNNFGNITYRILKSGLIDFPFDNFLIRLQSDIFGHGARYREFNFTQTSYEVGIPFPYGNGSGYTEGTSPRNASLDEIITAYNFGEVDATDIMAESIRSKWILEDSISYRDFFLYVGAYHSLSFYVWLTNYQIQNNQTAYQRSDIYQYINDINFKYNQPSKNYTINDLRNYSFINLLDPFQYLAIIQYVKYAFFGKEKGKLSMIKIGKISYLPSAHFGLTPFGAEYYLNNYFKLNDRLFNFYARNGDSRFENFYGFGLSITNIFDTKYFFVNASYDFWNQPSLILQSGETQTRNTISGIGQNISASVGFKFIKSVHHVSLFTQSGYKTDGFLQGENLASGFYLRLGLAFKP